MVELRRDSRARAWVLLVTAVVVVAAVTFGPTFLDRGPTPDGGAAYAVDALVPERAPADGAVAVDRQEESGVVLIDDAHNNRVTADQIKPLVAAVTAAGYEVDMLEGDESLDESLGRADAFVVVDPGSSYETDEVNRVDLFVDRGGRLLLVGEPTTLELTAFGLAERSNRLTSLSNRFGIEFGEAHLYNMHEYDGNHLNVFAEPAGDDRLTQGLSRTVFYTATRIHLREGRPLLETIDRTRSARDDAIGSYTVAAVNGNVLAIADGTFLRRGNYNVVDNERLVRNVVRFLVAGEKRGGLPSYPTFVSSEPVIRFTGPALVDAAQDVAVDLRASGRDPTMQLTRSAVSPADTDVLVTSFDYLDRHGQLSTGVKVTGDQVALSGYRSATRGLIVVRAPARGYELVVVADTPIRAQRAVGRLADGTLDLHYISDRTAVIRTGSASSTDASDGSG